MERCSESEARSLLDSIPPWDLNYQEWCDIGMALHYEGLPLSLWDSWSQRDQKRYSPGICESKWRSFKDGGKVVTMGTVYYMAKQHGWKPQIRVFGWDDVISSDLDGPPDDPEEIQEPGEEWNPADQARRYLEALYESGDHVAYTVSAYEKDGKWKPHSGICSRTKDDLIKSLQKFPGDVTDTFGTYNQAAGAWICFNPVDGKGRQNANITQFRFALVEGDEQPVEEQLQIMQQLQIPIRILVNSGGKSLHAIVHIGAKDYQQYSERVSKLYEICEKRGLKVDPQNKNPSRLSRLPGFMRDGRKQYIVAQDLGFPDWDSWEKSTERAGNVLPVVTLDAIWDNPPPLRPPLIDGILRRGHKLSIIASSKAGKTWTSIHLGICIAEGRDFLGYHCTKGPVLYVNLELDERSFANRVVKVGHDLGISKPTPGNFNILSLRGQALDSFSDDIIATAASVQATAIIIDPIYKLGLGDENSAEAISSFCRMLDRIADQTDASPIYVHHHSKGLQGGKASMDRASGSGVFARDADAIIDLMELETTEQVKQQYGPDARAFRAEFTLREFPPQEARDLIWDFPLLRPDDDGLLDGAYWKEFRQQQNNGRNTANSQKKAQKKSNKERLFDMIAQDEKNGQKRTANQYAEALGVSERTVYNYLSETEK